MVVHFAISVYGSFMQQYLFNSPLPSLSIYWHSQGDGMPRKKRMRPKKNQLHELPYTEIGPINYRCSLFSA